MVNDTELLEPQVLGTSLERSPPTEECAVGEEHKAWCQKITLGVNFAMKSVCAFGQYTLPLGFQFPPPNNGDDTYLAE